MSISLTAPQRVILQRGNIAIRSLLDFYFDSGRYSFWDGPVGWAYDSTTYWPIAEYGQISAIQTGQDLGAEGITITLNATRLLADTPGGGDPAYLMGEIEAETYQLRPVKVTFAFIDAETGALLFTIRRYSGVIDQVRQAEDIGSDGRATASMIFAIESVARRYGSRLGRTRTNEDQQAIWAGDDIFKFVAAAANKGGGIYWGRKPKVAASGVGGGVLGGGNSIPHLNLV